MKLVLTDKAPSRYGKPGDEIDVTKTCVRFFREQGWAVLPEEADTDAPLRDEYEALTGQGADKRWKAETLRRKIDEARNYQRRDMRAED